MWSLIVRREPERPGHVDWSTYTCEFRTESWTLMLHSPSLKLVTIAGESLILEKRVKEGKSNVQKERERRRKEKRNKRKKKGKKGNKGKKFCKTKSDTVREWQVHRGKKHTSNSQKSSQFTDQPLCTGAYKQAQIGTRQSTHLGDTRGFPGQAYPRRLATSSASFLLLFPA